MSVFWDKGVFWKDWAYLKITFYGYFVFCSPAGKIKVYFGKGWTYLRITFYGYFVFYQPKSQLQRDFQSLWALGARSLSHGKENYKCLQCQNKCNDGGWHKTAKSYFLKVPKNLDAENLWGRTENQGGGTEALVEAAKIWEDREAVCSQIRCPSMILPSMIFVNFSLRRKISALFFSSSNLQLFCQKKFPPKC